MTDDQTPQIEWHGVLLSRDDLKPDFVSARDRLADAAKAGDWSRVLAILDGRANAFVPGANDWRVGGTSWLAPLHQAAWRGAPADVVRSLIDRGAWSSLKDAEGRRPVDIACERGHDELVECSRRDTRTASGRKLRNRWACSWRNSWMLRPDRR